MRLRAPSSSPESRLEIPFHRGRNHRDDVLLRVGVDQESGLVQSGALIGDGNRHVEVRHRHGRVSEDRRDAASRSPELVRERMMFNLEVELDRYLKR